MALMNGLEQQLYFHSSINLFTFVSMKRISVIYLACLIVPLMAFQLPFQRNDLFVSPHQMTIKLIQHLEQLIYGQKLLKSRDFSYELCAQEKSTFQLSDLRVSPDPPRKGERLKIVLSGALAKNIEKGATLDLTVRYRRIRIYKKRLNFCEQLNKVENLPLKCPVSKGKKDLEYAVDLSKEILPGRYTVDVRLFDQDRSQVFCAKLKIKF
jgi:hypothetical protein